MPPINCHMRETKQSEISFETLWSSYGSFPSSFAKILHRNSIKSFDHYCSFREIPLDHLNHMDCQIAFKCPWCSQIANKMIHHTGGPKKPLRSNNIAPFWNWGARLFGTRAWPTRLHLVRQIIVADSGRWNLITQSTWIARLPLQWYLVIADCQQNDPPYKGFKRVVPKKNKKKKVRFAIKGVLTRQKCADNGAQSVGTRAWLIWLH